jgi:hypothetical protein
MTAEQRFRDAETPVDGALEIASVLERDAGNSASFHELRSAFDAACKGLDAQDSRRQFLAWEEGLFAYQLPETPDTKVDELVPFCQIGERRYPPRVEDFPDEVIAYFRQRLTRSQNPSARARLADILWLRTREISFADEAARARLEAARRRVRLAFCAIRLPGRPGCRSGWPSSSTPRPSWLRSAARSGDPGSPPRSGVCRAASELTVRAAR